jgi:hypothetical protein
MVCELSSCLRGISLSQSLPGPIYIETTVYKLFVLLWVAEDRPSHENLKRYYERRVISKARVSIQGSSFHSQHVIVPRDIRNAIDRSFFRSWMKSRLMKNFRIKWKKIVVISRKRSILFRDCALARPRDFEQRRAAVWVASSDCSFWIGISRPSFGFLFLVEGSQYSSHYSSMDTIRREG